MSNTDKTAKIEERIAQLLAKAESTTPEEAEALTEAAEKLMVKYMIDQATIEARRSKQGQASEKIIEERLDFTGAYRGELLHLSFMVTSSLGTLRAMQNTGQRNGKVFSFWIIGFESDVQQALTLINSLQLQAAVAVRAWWKEHKGEYEFESSYNQEKARRSFVHGFGTGVAIRLRASRQEVINDQTAAASKSTEIVLVSRKQRVDEHMDQTRPNLKNARGRNATGGDLAAAHGVAKGKEANTGERGVTRGRGISA